MYKTTKILMAAVLISLPIVVNAQTENPRGIYKMTTLTGRLGEINAPFEQYKVCTDSITLMVSEHMNGFNITCNDRQVLNYTGEQPKKEDDKSTLIYDSNAEQFKLKWWSTYTNHLYFPKDDWCIEKYESGKYSDRSKILFDALTGMAETDAKNPLNGTWRFIGYVDELRDVKKELPKLHEKYPSSAYYNTFMVFSPGYLTSVFNIGGGVDKVEYEGKKAYKAGDKVYQVKWLSRNRIAIEYRQDYRIDWMILERVTDGTTPLSHIASYYLTAGK